MKKLLLTLEYPPQKGGIAVYLENLVKQFNPQDIMVLAEPHPSADKFDSLQGYKIYRKKLLYSKFWPKWLKAFFMARVIVKKDQVDHLVISHILPMGYIAILLGLPFTVIIHGMDILSAQQSAWKRWWAGIILKKASYIIANSHFSQNEIVSFGVEKSKVDVCYPCPRNLLEFHFDVQRMNYLDQKYKLENSNVILSVNRLVSRKGNDTIISLMPSILKQIPNAKYLIVGNGPYQPELEKLIEKNNLKDKVLILNDVSDEDLMYFYRLSDLFVMPSRHQHNFDVEGFGIVFLEAALFNLPSISTFTGGIPEAIVDNQTGVLIEQDDFETMEKSIVNLLQNDEIRKNLGAAAKTRAVNEFQWQKQFAKAVEKLK